MGKSPVPFFQKTHGAANWVVPAWVVRAAKKLSSFARLDSRGRLSLHKDNCGCNRRNMGRLDSMGSKRNRLKSDTKIFLTAIESWPPDKAYAAGLRRSGGCSAEGLHAPRSANPHSGCRRSSRAVRKVRRRAC